MMENSMILMILCAIDSTLNTDVQYNTTPMLIHKNLVLPYT